MDLYVLIDSAFFGRGVFGVFSRSDLAYGHASKIQDLFCQWEIKRVELCGERLEDDFVYVAYHYYELYDCYTFDGVYANAEDAREAVGRKGLVVEFRVDSPDHKKLVSHR